MLFNAFRATLTSIAASALLPATALAWGPWGPEGHAIIAEIAEAG